MTIPKIIHHIWMGKKTIPDVNLYCANSIKETNPDFDYILWKDDDVDKVMKNDFPEYYDKFNELPRMIMKIDESSQHQKSKKVILLILYLT